MVGVQRARGRGARTLEIEPASGRAGARNGGQLPGAGSRSSWGWLRSFRRPPRLQLRAAPACFRCLLGESNAYLFACVQPLGLCGIAPGSGRWEPLQPQTAGSGASPRPEYTHSHLPLSDPSGGSVRKSPKAGEGEGRGGSGRFQHSGLSFQRALSFPGCVGTEPLKAGPPPALPPARG